MHRTATQLLEENAYKTIGNEGKKAIISFLNTLSSIEEKALFLRKCAKNQNSLDPSNATYAFQQLVSFFFENDQNTSNIVLLCALAKCYEHGWGTNKSNQKAITYYRDAAQYGDEQARSKEIELIIKENPSDAAHRLYQIYSEEVRTNIKKQILQKLEKLKDLNCDTAVNYFYQINRDNVNKLDLNKQVKTILLQANYQEHCLCLINTMKNDSRSEAACLEKLNGLIEEAPDVSQLCYPLGLYFHKQRQPTDFDQAIKYLTYAATKAIEVQDKITAKYALVEIYLAQQQYDLACEYLIEIKRFEPKHSEASQNLKTLAKKSRKAKAYLEQEKKKLEEEKNWVTLNLAKKIAARLILDVQPDDQTHGILNYLLFQAESIETLKKSIQLTKLSRAKIYFFHYPSTLIDKSTISEFITWILECNLVQLKKFFWLNYQEIISNSKKIFINISPKEEKFVALFIQFKSIYTNPDYSEEKKRALLNSQIYNQFTPCPPTLIALGEALIAYDVDAIDYLYSQIYINPAFIDVPENLISNHYSNFLKWLYDSPIAAYLPLRSLIASIEAIIKKDSSLDKKLEELSQFALAQLLGLTEAHGQEKEKEQHSAKDQSILFAILSSLAKGEIPPQCIEDITASELSLDLDWVQQNNNEEKDDDGFYLLPKF